MRRTLVRAARLWEGSVLGARVSAVNRGHSENIPGSGDMRGVVLRPSSWQDLQQKIEENTVESLGALGRTAVDIEVYREFRRQKLEEWDGMGSYIHNKIWEWESTLNEQGKRTVHMPENPSTEPIWIANDFPYSCDPGIEHHNIWCTKPMSEEEIAVVVDKHRPASEGWEVLTFVNPVELQSIRAIWHAHVFSRLAPKVT